MAISKITTNVQTANALGQMLDRYRWRYFFTLTTKHELTLKSARRLTEKTFGHLNARKQMQGGADKSCVVWFVEAHKEKAGYHIHGLYMGEASKAEIHKAWNVSIRTIGMMGHDAQRVARYAVTQYAIGAQGTSFVRCDWSRFTHLPYPVGEVLADCRYLLRNDVHHWTPWHATYKMVKNCARDLLLKGVHELKTGHVIGMDFMTQKPIILSTPYDENKVLTVV